MLLKEEPYRGATNWKIELRGLKKYLFFVDGRNPG